MEDSLLNNVSARIEKIFTNLNKYLLKLENDRLDVLKRKKHRNICFCILFLLVVAVWLIFSGTIVPWIVSVVTLIGYFIFSYYYVGKHENNLRFEFLKIIAPKIVNEFFPEAIYKPDDYISSSLYWHSELFKHSVDRYFGQNYVEGVFGETKIRFSHLHTEYKTETRNKNGGTTTTWHTIFEGIFMIADSNKAFKGVTLVVPDKAERLLGGIGKWMQEKLGSVGRGEMVYLENPEFEKKFVVYSTDPVEARYLLTPSMQQYLVDLCKHIKQQNFHLSYKGGNIYLAMPINLKIFDLNIRKSFDDIDTIRYYAKDLLDILNVIEILDLNTRIWGK